MARGWGSEQIPDQEGRTAIVTGANSGLGLVTALQLARHGASVILACRDTAKGQEALEQIRAAAPDARLELLELDLGDLASVAAFAEAFRGLAGEAGLDLLINNAGVMAPPRRVTADGFELQLGTNHLGHFALTGRLLGLMEGRARRQRGDPEQQRAQDGPHQLRRHPVRAPATCAGAPTASPSSPTCCSPSSSTGACGPPAHTVSSLAAHPGYAATNLQSAAAPLVDRLVMRVTNLALAQSAEMGALPTLYAATRRACRVAPTWAPTGRESSAGDPTCHAQRRRPRPRTSRPRCGSSPRSSPA